MSEIADKLNKVMEEMGKEEQEMDELFADSIASNLFISSSIMGVLLKNKIITTEDVELIKNITNESMEELKKCKDLEKAWKTIALKHLDVEEKSDGK